MEHSIFLSIGVSKMETVKVGEGVMSSPLSHVIMPQGDENLGQTRHMKERWDGVDWLDENSGDHLRNFYEILGEPWEA